MTTEERITMLEGQIKDLKEADKKLKEYKKLKEGFDDAAEQMAMIRDSLLRKDFTEEQAITLIIKFIETSANNTKLWVKSNV